MNTFMKKTLVALSLGALAFAGVACEVEDHEGEDVHLEEPADDPVVEDHPDDEGDNLEDDDV